MSDQPTPAPSAAATEMPDLSNIPLNALMSEIRNRVCAVTVWVEQDAIDEGYDPDSVSWKYVEEACTRAGFEAISNLGDPLDDSDDEDNDDEDEETAGEG